MMKPTMRGSTPEPDLTTTVPVAGTGSLHVVQAGPRDAPAVVFLHGWPEDWTEWWPVMQRARATHRAVALDLPGIGGSRATVPSGEKGAIAEVVHQAIRSLGLTRYAIVGHDAGAMVAYAYLRRFAAELDAAILLSSVIPGLEPWSKVLANPYVWHFGFHATPALPAMLVMGHQRAYFDHFFDVLTKDRGAIDGPARDRYAAAYGTRESLQAGFDWYRAFANDAKANRADNANVDVRMLYMRGEHETGDIDEYVAGLRQAGLTSVTAARIADSGHFTPEENPDQVWAEIARFLERA